ncbi:MAG: sulfate adenylyltransferase subunit CysN [Victivallales bacterium]|nr:sulfate adenylyltransferase subunit CysN [Victivallales bacterium]
MDIDKFLNQNENKDLLRFITCGAVDDGKSTLIGRLLYDSKLIFEDQLRTLQSDSEKVGTTQGTGEIDYALLLDGLKAEREQGITIDVAYRYFSTPKRKFIIADTPGHEEYTRNMATGASTANAAVILIDARSGVITQTKRHAFIVSLLGIKHIIVAVNKMDLVDYSEEVFHDIRQEFSDFMQKLDVPDIKYIPLSALKGDNVVDKSEKMAWHKGAPLLETLETVNILRDRNLSDFRFPVQYVIRPHLDFRGFAGTVVSGAVAVGDTVKVLPSLKDSKIKNIVTADGDLTEAFASQAISIELEDEIDISSGDMIVHANNQPKSSKHFEALMIWMNEKSFDLSRDYIIRHNGRNIKSRLDAILYKIDVNTLEKQDAKKLEMNEIGRVAISTTQAIYYDAYSKNNETGSLIVIDPLTNVTVGAGMIIETQSFDRNLKGEVIDNEDSLKKHVDRREFSWDTGLVDKRKRMLRNRHKGKTVLVIGSRDSASQELAQKLEEQLFELNMNTYYLGMSNLISGLDADINNDFGDRDEHIRRIGELARIMTDAGLIFITTIKDVDDYDAQRLKQLNYPNDLLVVNLGENRFKKDKADIDLGSKPDIEKGIEQIMSLLSSKSIIPEYCI